MFEIAATIWTSIELGKLTLVLTLGGGDGPLPLPEPLRGEGLSAFLLAYVISLIVIQKHS
jgi:hypothetical protein